MNIYDNNRICQKFKLFQLKCKLWIRLIYEHDGRIGIKKKMPGDKKNYNLHDHDSIEQL